MFGYACRETDELMPLPIMLAHRLARRLAEVRRERRAAATCAPTARARSRCEYVDGKPVRVETVVISTQHSPDVTLEQLREDVIEQVVAPDRARRT